MPTKKIALRKKGKIFKVIAFFPMKAIVVGDVILTNEESLEKETYSGTNEYTSEGYRIFEFKNKGK